MRNPLYLLLPLLIALGLASCNKAFQQEENGKNSYSIDISFESLDNKEYTMVLTITSASGPKDLDIKVTGKSDFTYMNNYSGTTSNGSCSFGPTRKHAEKGMRLEFSGIPLNAITGTVNLTIEFYRTKEQVAKDDYNAAMSGDLEKGLSLYSPVDCNIVYTVAGHAPNFLTGYLTINGKKLN